MKETNYFCDECGAKLHSQACVTVTVFAHQGYHNYHDADLSKVYANEQVKKWADEYWKHKEIYHRLLCPDCVGGRANVDFNHGDDPYFAIKDKARYLLSKIGAIKNITT